MQQSDQGLRCPFTETFNTCRIYTIDSHHLEVQGTLRNISRYPYLDISDLQNKEKHKPKNYISKMNMYFDS